LIPTFATFVTCLVIAVEYGILIGVGINLLFLLYPSARPTVHVEKSTVSFSRSWAGKVDLCGLHVWSRLLQYAAVHEIIPKNYILFIEKIMAGSTTNVFFFSLLLNKPLILKTVVNSCLLFSYTRSRYRSGMSVSGCVVPDVLKKCSVSIFRDKQYKPISHSR